MKKSNKAAKINHLNILYILLAAILITIGLFDIMDTKVSTTNSIINRGINDGADLEVLDESMFKEDHVLVDLALMKLSTHSNGKLNKSYSLVSKGKPGSYYETPAGSYVAGHKFINKFSRLGNVYMPYSIQFQGNYFIHGIPYHQNGERVSSAYSGGCIRLNDNDAKEVFDFVKNDTKIIVVNSKLRTNHNPDLSQELSVKLFHILISLDVSNQEREISYNGNKVKALSLVELAINGDDQAYQIIVNNIPDLAQNIKIKSEAIGLSGSNFDTKNDREVIYYYIENSKSFLLNYL
jgi:L,D-transpeptidase catalytic domain